MVPLTRLPHGVEVQASKHVPSLNSNEELLRELFLGGMAHVDPETGHITERFWLAMWDPENYVSWHDGDVGGC